MNINDSNIRPELTFRRLVYLHMQQLTNFPYIEQDFDALTDYELLCLVVKYLNDVIDNSNEQNTSITNLYNAFLQLQTYMNNSVQELEAAWNNKTTELETSFNNLQTFVNNYFDNLDVQDEINNKLDQMLEDGVLEQIIEQFLQSTAVWCFDTVASMKQATNLTNGSYCKTLGYYAKNDGGMSTYKIRTKTNDDVIDEMFLISLHDNTLLAELIIDELNIKQLGAYGDNVHDDTNSFKAFCSSSIKNIIIPYGTYLITDILDFSSNNLYGKNCVIKTTDQSTTREHQIHFSGSCYVENIEFRQANATSLIGLFGNNLTTFNNCRFIVDNVATDGYVDLYTDNTNIVFNDCYFECDSYNGSTLTTGGIWIREYNSEKTSKNIKLIGCTIYHNTVDEAIAIWNWNGNVSDVLIDNCIIKAKDTCASPHFISLDAPNCILSNSIIYGPSVTSNSLVKGLFWNKINDCIITGYTRENNGISSGNNIFNNCKITIDVDKTYLSVNKLNIFKNCEITVKSFVDTRNIEFYNCVINSTNDSITDNRCFSLSMKAKDTIFNIASCKGFCEAYFADGLNISLDNCEVNVTTGKFMVLSNSSQTTNTLKVCNCILNKSDITASSGYVATGYIANNIVKTSLTALTGVTMDNNIVM